VTLQSLVRAKEGLVVHRVIHRDFHLGTVVQLSTSLSRSTKKARSTAFSQSSKASS
jgi:hypothetical protein